MLEQYSSSQAVTANPVVNNKTWARTKTRRDGRTEASGDGGDGKAG